jgi:hypothetical protein
MVRLIDILKEINENQIDISDLNILDDEIKKALEDAPKNEIVGTISLALAIPGTINAITKVIGSIAKKSGIQLKKSDPKWYQVLEKLTGEIDDYLDRPIRAMLTPFIKDISQRDKIAKVIKAVSLTLAAIYGAVDVKQIQSTTSLIKNLAPDIGQQLVQTIAEKNPSKIANIIKPLFG